MISPEEKAEIEQFTELQLQLWKKYMFESIEAVPKGQRELAHSIITSIVRFIDTRNLCVVFARNQVRKRGEKEMEVSNYG